MDLILNRIKKGEWQIYAEPRVEATNECLKNQIQQRNKVVDKLIQMAETGIKSNQYAEQLNNIKNIFKNVRKGQQPIEDLFEAIDNIVI